MFFEKYILFQKCLMKDTILRKNTAVIKHDMIVVIHFHLNKILRQRNIFM